MKERLKHPQLSTLASIGVTLGILVVIMLFSMGMALLAQAVKNAFGWNVMFMEYIEYALIIGAGVWLGRRWLLEYEYALVDDELIINQYLGRRGKNMYRTWLRDIRYVGREEPRDYHGKKKRLTYKRRNMAYIVDGAKCVSFSPSDKLLELIEQRRHAK